MVNIPEDHQRVGEPSEADGEQVKLTLFVWRKLFYFLSFQALGYGWCNEQDLRGRYDGR